MVATARLSRTRTGTRLQRQPTASYNSEAEGYQCAEERWEGRRKNRHNATALRYLPVARWPVAMPFCFSSPARQRGAAGLPKSAARCHADAIFIMLQERRFVGATESGEWRGSFARRRGAPFFARGGR